MREFESNYTATFAQLRFIQIIIKTNRFQTLCEHLEEHNIEGFTDAVKDYDSISRLDQWYTTILLRIKKQHNEEEDLK